MGKPNGWSLEPGHEARAQARARRQLAERLENQNVSWLGDPDVVESYYEDSPALIIVRWALTALVTAGFVIAVILLSIALGG